VLLADVSAQNLIGYAALASRAEGEDTIDKAIIEKREACVNELVEKGYRTLSDAVGANPPKAKSYHLKSPWKVTDYLA